MASEDQTGQNTVDEQQSATEFEPQKSSEGEKDVSAAENAANADSEVQPGSTDTPDGQAAKIEALQEQVDKFKDQALRAQAEAQNTRRRAQKDVESAHKFALEKFAQDLLPVIDNLERAIQACDKSNEQLKSFLEGVELTRKSFVDALKKHGLEQLDPHGEPFDPKFHQAMTMVEMPESEPNTVIEVMQRGYTLNGRLVRPAMVVVSKAAPSVDMKA